MAEERKRRLITSFDYLSPGEDEDNDADDEHIMACNKVTLLTSYILRYYCTDILPFMAQIFIIVLRRTLKHPILSFKVNMLETHLALPCYTSSTPK